MVLLVGIGILLITLATLLDSDMRSRPLVGQLLLGEGLALFLIGVFAR